MALLLKLQENAGRAQNVTGVYEGSMYTSGDLEDLPIDCSPPEMIETIERVQGRIKRFICRAACTVVPDHVCTIARVCLMHVGGIQHDQSRQFTRGRRCNDLAPEPPLSQQRQTPAMIQVCVG